MALRELEAKNAKPRERAYKLADGLGLFLLIQSNGSKLWRMKYRFAGREKLLSFGAYPALSLAAARDRRNVAKQILAQGKDPMVNKSELRHDKPTTFLDIARQWHQNRKTGLDPAHAQRVWSRLERDVIPALGPKGLHEITPPDVLEVIRRIEERGALDISRRAKQGIGQVFQFAIASGLASSDPTAHLRGALKSRPRVKHMSRVPIEELPRLLETLRNYEQAGARRSTVTQDAVMFALLTWVRSKELRFALKREFERLDDDTPVWRIPAERMKMGREHLVPLAKQAAEVARRLVIKSGSDFLFPGAKPNLPISENTMIYALYRMGYLGRQTVHGFRGIASTWANEQLIEIREAEIWIRKYHEDWVEMQLAHSENNAVRGAYNAAEYLEPRRRMLQDWANFVSDQEARGLQLSSKS